MRRISLRLKLLGAGVVALLVAAVAVGWTQRMPLLAWYTVRGLSQAADSEQDLWIDRVAALDDFGTDALLDCLASPDAQARDRAGTALAVIGRRSPPVASRLADRFGSLPDPARRAALQALNGLLSSDDAPCPDVVAAAGQVLGQVDGADSETAADALALAETLVRHGVVAEMIGDCRALVQASLRDAAASNRVKAVRLASHPDLGLLEQAMALLHDPDAEVRREAMVAVRLTPETVVKTDDLLHWLHDSDEDVRRLCEAVLSLRGMKADQIKLGRMLTDSDALVRLKVLGVLAEDDDLEPGVWLRLLSVDAEPAVRVAAVRFASDHPLVDMSDRIDQMAQGDPSATVRDLAQKYLRKPRPRQGPMQTP